MKLLTVVGARPQFVKAATVSRVVAKTNSVEEQIIHTGQHFDKNMSEVFFTEMKIPKPHYNLGVSNLGHGAMTGRMMEALEKIFVAQKPDWVLVYGDTNSTLAAALTASKLHIKVAHVEAGLRSFNMKMPEEVNRILTDRISNILFCPTDTAIQNLQKEGFESFDSKIIQCGDVMLDAALFYQNFERKPDFDLPKEYVLATIHRAENTNDLKKLKIIIDTFNEISKSIPIVFPIHPRTKKILEDNNISTHFKLIPPVGYLEMIYLIRNSKMVMTDSGGLQKEAYFFKKPCLTLRDQTEWIELIQVGANELTPITSNDIISNFETMIASSGNFENQLYGDGNAAKKIIQTILDF